ncbi:mucin-2-like [Calliphora vicina]|uniref:mucin-2-like n=1 Tax=Calliphora vicina TaxID=7373 RepID=UPI00325AA6B4
MTNWPSRKRVQSYTCAIHTKKKRKNLVDNSQKVNYKDFTKSNPNETTQYLYADPSFIMEAAISPHHRLEGGGVGSEQQEVYYDCWPCDCEREPQLQIFEVINQIKNPKDFKSLLKQIVHTSSVLYQTFRQAYDKTKKIHKNSLGKYSETCCNKCEKPDQKMECGDMNPLEIINIEIPANNREYLEDVTYESLSRKKHKKKKSPKCFGGQQQCCFVCDNCQDKENICNTYLGSLEPETDICEAKNSQKSLATKKMEQFNEIIKKEERPLSDEKKECDFSTWFTQTPSCLMETNACQQYEDELQHLNFCDKCAVLRGEMALPSKLQNEPLYNNKPDVCEKSSQTCQKIKCSKTEPCSKSQKPVRPLQQPAKQVLNLSPVCVTIPLKLQIDSQNCQSRFIETEIVMEAFSGSQTCKLPQPLKTNIPTFSSPITPTNSKTPTSTSKQLQKKCGSDLFYSCISSSGIIKPEETPEIVGEPAVKEVPLPEIRSQTKSIQATPPESSVATTMTANKTFTSRMDFTQTEEIALPSVASPDPKAKAKQLRADLLEEVRATLEQTTPIAALKLLLEGKRFSLPSNLRPKEMSNTTPARHSFPSNYQAMPASSTPLQPLKPLTTPLSSTREKPTLPPKPKLPTKPASFVTETVQTDASTIKASGHYKRNEMRTEIQDELKELLQPNPLKTSAKYAPEERDEILLDLHKLFHPEKAGRLPKQISRENALQDIRFLVEPEAPKPEITFPADSNTPKTSESQESIIQSIKHILNPKTQQKSNKKKKYDKQTKEKILEDLQIILTPKQKKPEINQEIRASVLHDLRFMLDTGQETTSPNRPPRLSEMQSTAIADTGPSSSQAQQVRQQRQQKPPNEIRDSLIADLRYLLDTTHPPQSNNSKSFEDNLLASARQAPPVPPSIPTIPKKSQSTISSEASLSDNDKRNEKHK